MTDPSNSGTPPQPRSAHSDPHRRGERFLVLYYHRVTESGRPDFLPPALNCPRNVFLEHVAILKQHCSVLPLEEAWTLAQEGRALPPRTVVLTFDDCWAENMTTVAAPLAEAGMPATFFVSAGDIDRDDLHPNHLFYYLIDQAGPERFREALLSLLGSPAALPDAVTPSYRVRVDTEAALGSELTSASGRAFLARLEQLLHAAPSTEVARSLYLRSHQVRQLRSYGIEVGNHTLTHRDLTKLTQVELREEMVSARDRLIALTSRAVTTLAYPYGRFNESAIGMAAATGHRCACTVKRGYNDGHTDPWRVRRIDSARISGPQLLTSLAEHGSAA